MFITVSRELSIPIHEQIFFQLKSQILLGELAAGTRLPSVRQMSNLLKVNRHTISKVYLELEKSGLVKTHASSGTFVREELAAKVNGDHNLQALKDLIEQTYRKAKALGFNENEFFGLFYTSLLRNASFRPKALFIECNRYALDQYVEDIGREIPADVDGCLLSELEDGETPAVDVTAYDIIMTTLGHYADVKMRLPDNQNLYALNFGPYLSVVNQIRELARDSRLAIVCVSRAGAEGLKETLIDLGVTRNIVQAVDVANRRVLVELAAQVDVFVVSKYALRQAPGFFQACDRHIIEYKNVLQKTSVMMMNQVIATMQKQNALAYAEPRGAWT